MYAVFVFFFFQAEDGIRDLYVTGVQTCALPISGLNAGDSAPMAVVGGEGVYFHLSDGRRLIDGSNTGGGLGHRHPAMVEAIRKRSEERRVGKECRSGWARDE